MALTLETAESNPGARFPHARSRRRCDSDPVQADAVPATRDPLYEPAVGTIGDSGGPQSSLRDDINQAIRGCAGSLQAIAAAADLNRVGPSTTPRAAAEEAMAFAGFLIELARPLDAMLHQVLIAGADNFKLLSDRERRDARTIISECAIEDWAGRFVTWAEVEAGDDTALPDAAFYSDRYARRIADHNLMPSRAPDVGPEINPVRAA